MRRILHAAPILAIFAISLPVAIGVESAAKPSAAVSGSTPASTAIALAEAAKNLPSAQRTPVTQAALSILLLTKYNRLLPPNLTPQNLDQLSQIFLAANPDEIEQTRLANKLPPADSLVFDGSKLSGGNFRHIDSLIGITGQPIALDRELPAYLIPLTPAAATALTASRTAFQSTPDFPRIADITDRIYQCRVDPFLAADGIFCRPYAGRIDDLYLHLMQNGDRSGRLDYFALLDTLPTRQYSPVSGCAARDSVPLSRVNLSDILSGGSLGAIQTYRRENPRANVNNPFKGLAVRLIPYITEALRATPPGSRLEVTRDMMRRAITDPRRFTPGKVPPLFNDPSRFLGWLDDPRYLRVAKKKKPSHDLSDEIQKIDFETPLPEMMTGPAGNELLQDNLLSPKEASADVETHDLLRDLGMPTPPMPKKSPPPPTVDFKPPLEKPEPPTLEPETAPPLSDTLLALLTSEPEALPTPKPEKPKPTLPLTPSAIAKVEEPSAVPSTLLEPLQTPTPAPTQTPPPAAFVAVVASTSPTPSATSTSPSPSPEPQAPTAQAPQKSSETLDFITSAPAEPFAPPLGNRPPSFQVAVLTPTIKESVDYLKKIISSDQALTKNVYESNRAECLIRWLGDALKPLETFQDDPAANGKKFEPLIRQARDEIVALLKQRDELKAQRQEALQDRAALRKALEYDISTRRRDELARLTGISA